MVLLHRYLFKLAIYVVLYNLTIEDAAILDSTTVYIITDNDNNLHHFKCETLLK